MNVIESKFFKLKNNMNKEECFVNVVFDMI